MNENRVQRRLAAILSADVVGYSRMMRDDEAGTHAQIKALRGEIFEPKTREHNGRIFNTSGDGVLIEFASVVDAVQLALDVQSALERLNAEVDANRKIEVRIGINLGDVIADGDDVYGDGVNIAARLEAIAPAGGICISSPVYESIRHTVAAEFEDLGERTVKNIGRPVRVFSVSSKISDGSPVGLVALSIAERAQGAVRTHRSIAVLPFDNLGHDDGDQHLCDGMTEDVITLLSHIEDLSILARTTTMSLKGSPIDIQEVGRKFGVDLVVEGSVRRAGDRVRVTAQLVDVATGRHVWADRYDRELVNVFDLQDDITANIAAALQVRLVEGAAAQTWRHGAGDYETWRMLLEARNYERRATSARTLSAIRLLSEAVRRKPDSALLWAHLAFAYCQNARHGWSKDPTASMREAEEAAKRAITLDDSLAFVHCYAGQVYLNLSRHDEAIAYARRAVEIAPDDAENAIFLAHAMMWGGRLDEALPLFENACQLFAVTPPAPLSYFAECHRLLGQLDQATNIIRSVLEKNPEVYVPYLIAALIYGQQGDDPKAKTAFGGMLQIEPDYSEHRFRTLMNYRDRDRVERSVAILKSVGLRS